MSQTLKRVLGPFLKDDQRVLKTPTHQRMIYLDEQGNELWARIYQQETGFCLATVMTKFPKQQIEVETKYDFGYPPRGVDPLEPCIQGITNDWGVKHFIEFHKIFFLRRIDTDV